MRYARSIGVLTVAATMLATGAGPARAETELVVVSWVGSYQESQVKGLYEPFMRDNPNIKIVSKSFRGDSSRVGQIKEQVESGNVEWSVIDVVPGIAIQGCAEGFLEKIDAWALPPGADGTAATRDFLPGTLLDCAVGEVIYSTVFIYDHAHFGSDESRPTTLDDFFDVKKFPGKRGLARTPKVNLEWALLSDGVPADQIYDTLATEAGLDRAFRVLGSIKDHLVWWDSGDDQAPMRLLKDGEVVMTSAWNTGVYAAIKAGSDNLRIVWDGNVRAVDYWAIPKGAPNQDAALTFIEYATGSRRLADLASATSAGPARASSMDLIDEEIEPMLPTTPENFAAGLQRNPEFWADNLEALEKRLDTWLAKESGGDGGQSQ